MKSDKKVAIMQPYFLPYIGYWQLMNYVDTFVVYDEIQYTKKGWINRNRYLSNGNPTIFSLPLRKGSDYFNVNQRLLAVGFESELKKTLRKIEGAYRKAPYFDEGRELLNECFSCKEINLFDFIFNSINYISKVLDIDTKLKISSTLTFDNSLRGEDKVIAICKAAKATQYINPIGGIDLYCREQFTSNSLNLYFQRPHRIEYNQSDRTFVPSLSIIDVVMFNGIEGTKALLSKMDVI